MTEVVGFAHIERFRSVVANRLGLHFEEPKTGFLGDVLRHRLELTGQPFAGYLDLVDVNPSRPELFALARELTVGETYFFRNIDQFRAFSGLVLPDRMQVRAVERKLRILSAACSSGEEAYSLAIMLQRAAIDPTWDISIFAVDINPAAIDAARQARYSTWALRETPREIQQHWFHATGEGKFSLDDSLGRNIRFEVRNLVSADAELWQPEKYDVIFCRNVIMYFTPEASRTVVERITRSLAPGGYLFLGHAETLRGLSQDFHLRHTHGTFYYQRKDCINPCRNSPPSAGAHESEASPPALLREIDSGDTWVDTIRKASERIQALAAARPAPSEDDRTHVSNSKEPKWDLALPMELLLRENFTAALDVMRALPPESAKDPDVLLLHAVLLAHRGQFTASQDVCARLLGIDELNAGAHYVLALCHEGLGDGGEAANHNLFAVYLDSGFAMPHLHLGLIARRRADPATAQRELAQALMLLQREDASRLLLFGGGFSRDALIALCRTELATCGAGHE